MENRTFCKSAIFHTHADISLEIGSKILKENNLTVVRNLSVQTGFLSFFNLENPILVLGHCFMTSHN